MYIKSLIEEQLEREPSLVTKPMFGCHAFYLHGRLMLVAAEKDPPNWRGLLIGMERENHEALKNKIPELKAHKILGKWLYLSEELDNFEELAHQLAQMAKNNEECMGVYKTY